MSLFKTSILTFVLIMVRTVSAQEVDHSNHEQATMSSNEHSMMEHAAGDHMRGMLGNYMMSRESSGTSWQPDSSPMMARQVEWNGWKGMIHAEGAAVYSDAHGPRGDTDTFVESMFMGMARTSVSAGIIGVRAMLSLDPLLVGKRGYPLLFQTGESADGKTPLIDRQHPHDLFMELAGSFAHPLSDDQSIFIYTALPGEPALGPPTFMHRFSGMANPEVPILHHWLDATHITFGVATLGYIRKAMKLEVSAFNGREPDEDRYDIEAPSLKSWSTRLSYNIGSNLSAQISYGSLKSPERLEPEIDVDRTTISAIYNLPLHNGNWQTTIAWGRNHKSLSTTTAGYLLESAYAWSSNTVLLRFEDADKDELFKHNSSLSDEVFTVRKLSLGYVRGINAKEFNLSAGIIGSVHFIDDVLDRVYRSNPTSISAFVRLSL